MNKSEDLWMVRHGATDWNTIGRLTGWSDVPLNTEGQRQAIELRPQLSHRAYTAVWSSDLRRAIETARLAWGEPRTDSRLRELDFGTLEGSRWKDLDRTTQHDLLKFEGFQAPSGESTNDLRQRLHDFLTSLADGSHLIFTHGGIIRLLLRASGQDDHIQPGHLIKIGRADITL